jgi:hypothetical protein
MLVCKVHLWNCFDGIIDVYTENEEPDDKSV